LCRSMLARGEECPSPAMSRGRQTQMIGPSIWDGSEHRPSDRARSATRRTGQFRIRTSRLPTPLLARRLRSPFTYCKHRGLARPVLLLGWDLHVCAHPNGRFGDRRFPCRSWGSVLNAQNFEEIGRAVAPPAIPFGSRAFSLAEQMAAVMRMTGIDARCRPRAIPAKVRNPPIADPQHGYQASDFHH
jgi:hypothetical protein